MDAQALQAWAQVAGDVIAVGLGGFAVYQLKAALSQVDLLRQQVDLLADQVKLQRDDLALQREAIAAEAERNRKRDELLEGQLGELQRRQRELDRQQANLVRADWTQGDPPPNITVGEPGTAARVARITNSSLRPIREVRAGLRFQGEQYRHADVIRVPSTTGSMTVARDYRVAVIQAGEARDFGFPFAATSAEQMAVQFIDDDGRAWQIEHDYSLREFNQGDWSV